MPHRTCNPIGAKGDWQEEIWIREEEYNGKHEWNRKGVCTLQQKKE
jgi:hypothetical protein